MERLENELCCILQPFRHFTYVTTHSPTFPSLHLRHSSFSNPSVILPMSLHILQPFHCFTYVTVHSLTVLSLLLRHKLFSSFSKLSVTSHTSQLILQPFRCFTYVRAHSPTLSLLHLRHSSFSNPHFASPTSLALHWRHLASRPCVGHQRMPFVRRRTRSCKNFPHRNVRFSLSEKVVK